MELKYEIKQFSPYEKWNLENNGENVLFVYNAGDGNDTISGFNETSTLSIAGASPTSVISGDDVIYKVGNGSIRLLNAASIVYPNTDTITLDDDPNTYSNSDYGATIRALGGDDTISNTGSKVSISGGADNDVIYNSGSFTTVNAGEGSDLISLSGDNENNIIEYAEGDGNDTIYGFNEIDKLIISDVTSDYYTQRSGADIIVNVGKSTITLVDAANLLDVDIDVHWGEVTTKGNFVNLKGENNYYSNSADNFAINAGAGNDSIYNGGANVTINVKDGDNYISNGGDYAKISVSAGDDSVINVLGNHVSIAGGAGDDSIIRACW